ncbi:hypothetical protein B194_5140 [Serratia plymuthica A30]|nr:hypothetical protein B194_5140 [Serratia plymuthica A30]
MANFSIFLLLNDDDLFFLNLSRNNKFKNIDLDKYKQW